MQTDFAPEHLPAWMRQPRRSIDWGVLLAAALGLIAAWTLLFRDGVPLFTGLEHSAFMAADVADALSEGQLLARWSPHALSGYGAPIPAFYSQGAATIVAITDELLTANTASALRLVLVGALVSAGIGQYLFCRRWIAPANALMATGLYVFSPALGLVAPHIAGDLSGVVGMAALPLALWAATRSLLHTSRWDVPVSALAFATLLYIHPQLAGAGAGIALLLTLPAGFAALQRLVLALVAAIALFAPFWLPALNDLAVVRWRAAVTLPRDPITLAGLLTPLRASDPYLLNPPVHYTLGLLLPSFALGGLVWAATHQTGRRFATALFTVGLASAVIAIMDDLVWPVYVLTMCCAALGGLALEWRMRLPLAVRRTILSGALVLLIVASSAVWLAPDGPTRTDFTPLAQIQYEMDGFGVAAQPEGERLPFTLAANLTPERNLIESYREPPYVRIRPGTPARITPIVTGTHSSVWQVSATTPATITLSLAWFPDWEASLNGEPLTVEREPSSGLVRVLLPPVTNGTLRVFMGATPPILLVLTIFAVTLIVLGLWARFSPAGEPVNVLLLNLQELRLTAFALAFAGLAVFGAALPDSRFDLRPAPASSLQDAQHITAVGDPLSLLAYRFDTSRVRAGDAFAFTLYWSAVTTPALNYAARVWLIDINTQQRIVLSTLAVPGGIPTRGWQPDYAVVDRRHTFIPTTIQNGAYQLSVEVLECATVCITGTPQSFRDRLGILRPAIVLPAVVTVEEERLPFGSEQVQ